MSGFQGLQRQVLFELMRCTGAKVDKEMQVNQVTHVVAKDPQSNAKKLEVARKYAHFSCTVLRPVMVVH